jgi:hypothetical protein
MWISVPPHRHDRRTNVLDVPRINLPCHFFWHDDFFQQRYPPKDFCKLSGMRVLLVFARIERCDRSLRYDMGILLLLPVYDEINSCCQFMANCVAYCEFCGSEADRERPEFPSAFDRTDLSSLHSKSGRDFAESFHGRFSPRLGI